ncbi:hypothetical protein BV25DRAFT_1903137 [Artomyces pyxidatus]|uniref:Uncharacterized protein n=1 Tax=Artomyces pyxidatus TaxID=48021 RepID=A0ACB8SJQ5_9AGAM|nr:hypothetical protein BV25DRAFT_1903137 [Artomyces pyxidatus]
MDLNTITVPSHLLICPDEVLLQVLENLDHRAVLACQAACHRLKNITNAVSLQYTVELAACGMVDGMRCQETLSLSERLERLRQYDAAWRQLKWSDCTLLPHLTNDRVVIHVGAYKFGIFSKRNVVQELPSKLRGLREEHYSCQSMRRIKVDSSQGLVVYIETPAFDPLGGVQYNLRSLPSGEPHPRAANLGIIKPSAWHKDHIVDIRGEYLLEFLQFGETGRYIVRNWTTGLVEMQKEMKFIVNGSSCRFLDDNYIFLDSFPTNSHFLSVDQRHESFHVLPFRRCEGSTSGTVHDTAVHFLLPAAVMNNELSFYMTTFSTGSGTAPMTPVHFYRDPDDHLISTSIRVRDDEAHTSRNYHFDIPAQTFTSYMQHNLATGQTVVPWEAWGPHGTRVIEEPEFQESVCGMRRCLYRQSDEGTILRVLDYHPRRVARALARRQDGDGIVVEHGAHIEAGHTGGDPLSTTLPCLVTETHIPHILGNNGGEIVLCEDGVVFTERRREVWEGYSNVLAYTI